MQPVSYKPIGVIHTPFRDLAGMPIQPRAAEGITGTVEVYPEYAAGLKDLDGFSRIILIYHFHQCTGWSATPVPFLDNHPRGVFSTRAPRRPNPIGISIVGLIDREENILTIEGVDMLDETPLLDIKPYIPEFDAFCGGKTGWFPEHPDLRNARSDGRFAEPGDHEHKK